MEIDLLKAKRDEASREEDFWWLRHRECADAAARDDYGWLWLNARHRRQKLDLMIQKQRALA